MKAVFGTEVHEVGFLAHMMGLQPGEHADRLSLAQPGGLATGDVRLRQIGRRATCEEGANGSRPGRPSLGRPDLASVDSGTSRADPEPPLLLIATRRPEPDPGVSALEASAGDRVGVPVPKVGAFSSER